MIITSILNHAYVPEATLAVEIPKGKGKPRRLGIPTVVERWLQQAVSQVLRTKLEWNFESHSDGFRSEKNTQQAVLLALKTINDGYEDMVDLDVQGCFAEVDHRLLLQRIYKRVKGPTTLRRIRKWRRVPIRIKGRLQQRRKGKPQGSPLSPLLSNIRLLDYLFAFSRSAFSFLSCSAK